MTQKDRGFRPSKGLEITYRRKLLTVAREVRRIVQSNRPPGEIAEALTGYAGIVGPWAEQMAEDMARRVAASTWATWKRYSRVFGKALWAEVSQGAVERRIAELAEEGARLIKSLPLEASARVVRVAQEGAVRGARSEALREEILRTGDVTWSRAEMIARTETGRATTILTQARAEGFGSTGYIWRTSKDARTRDSHLAMEGHFVLWNAPPTLDGLTGHAGALPNCRCYPEPVIPELDER